MELQDKHCEHAGYLDSQQIDFGRSWAVASKHDVYGSRLVYQHITMKDGTIYGLRSQTASTRGILAPVVAWETTQRDVKRHFDENTIGY